MAPLELGLHLTKLLLGQLSGRLQLQLGLQLLEIRGAAQRTTGLALQAQQPSRGLQGAIRQAQPPAALLQAQLTDQGCPLLAKQGGLQAQNLAAQLELRQHTAGQLQLGTSGTQLQLLQLQGLPGSPLPAQTGSQVTTALAPTPAGWLQPQLVPTAAQRQLRNLQRCRHPRDRPAQLLDPQWAMAAEAIALLLQLQLGRQLTAQLRQGLPAQGGEIPQRHSAQQQLGLRTGLGSPAIAQLQREQRTAGTATWGTEIAAKAQLPRRQIQIKAAIGKAPGGLIIELHPRCIQQRELQTQARRWLVGIVAGKHPELPGGIGAQLQLEPRQADRPNPAPLAQAGQQIRPQGEPLQLHGGGVAGARPHPGAAEHQPLQTNALQGAERHRMGQTKAELLLQPLPQGLTVPVAQG